MSQIEERIAQHRIRPVRLRVLTPEGYPTPNIFITVEQRSSFFQWGIRLKEEELAIAGFVEHLRRFTHSLLVEWPPSFPVKEVLTLDKWKVIAAVTPPPDLPPKKWVDGWIQPFSELPTLQLERWAFFLPKRGSEEILEEIRQARGPLEKETGIPLCLFGLTLDQILPLDEKEVGLSLVPPSGNRWHLAELYRILRQIEKACKEVYLYDLSAPAEGFFYTRRSEELGGSERAQSDYLTDIVTLSFSSPAVKGVYFKGLADVSQEEKPTGLITSEGRPRRAYKMLRRMIHQHWRSLGYGVTDHQGEWTFQGFSGEYQVTLVQPNGRYLLLTLRLPSTSEGETLWEIPLEGADSTKGE